MLELDDVLAFKPSLRLWRPDGGPGFLIGERERFVLSARAAQLAELIDGQRTVDEIMRAARLRISEPEVLYTLQEMTASGHLVPATPAFASRAAVFWHAVGLDGAAAVAALAQHPVSVQALGEGTSARWMIEALAQAGLTVDDGAPTRIVVVDDYLDGALAPINQRSLAGGTRWCLVKPTGVRPFFGPMFHPGTGPCWQCLTFWLRNNRPVDELVRRHRNGEAAPAPAATLEASARTACGLGALAIARLLAEAEAGVPHALGHQLMALDLTTLQTSAHAVVKRPQCPACGDPALTARLNERPIELQAIGKAHFEDGGYRRQTPQRTWERYQHLVSPITGPVTHVVPLPGRHTDLRAVYASGYLVCPRNEVPTTNVFDKGCAGKGRSAEQARVSALCEALERYSGVHQGDEGRVRGSREELGPGALDLADLLNFSEAQYRGRDRVNRPGADLRQFVSEPFDPAAAIDWVPGWSLTRNERRHVPLSYCYAEAPLEAGTRFTRPCGNGVAAGTCVEEALLQGLLELVERDAAAIWWYNRLRRPAIDLASFDDPYFEALRADYARLGWSVWALDLTHDLGIATCVALAHHPGDDRFAIGFGCHLEPRLATQRALTELNQLFEPAGHSRAPWDLARMVSREFLTPDPARAPATALGMPRFSGADLRADLQHCLSRLERAGLELVAVDKTRPDIGLHVVQAIVPGLRHFWPRFGPGRLYQVPCDLGWLAAPLAEGDLNPVPLFV